MQIVYDSSQMLLSIIQMRLNMFAYLFPVLCCYTTQFMPYTTVMFLESSREHTIISSDAVMIYMSTGGHQWQANPLFLRQHSLVGFFSRYWLGTLSHTTHSVLVVCTQASKNAQILIGEFAAPWPVAFSIMDTDWLHLIADDFNNKCQSGVSTEQFYEMTNVAIWLIQFKRTHRCREYDPVHRPLYYDTLYYINAERPVIIIHTAH